jgi:MFS family permease
MSTSVAAPRTAPSSLPILVGVAVTLGLSMGLRQSLGLFVRPATHALSLALSDFTLAIAVQNLFWGILQPFAGVAAVRYGFRVTMTAGAVCYVAGLAVLGCAQGAVGVMIGAGVLIGTGLASTAGGLSMAAASRPVSAASRSSVLGIVSSAGSLGALLAAPYGQSLTATFGWRAGVLGFAALALVMIPAAWIAGRVDRIPMPAPTAADGSALSAARAALRNGPFMVMTGAYFVCGLQLVFLTTHLPSYLALCGMDPMLAAQALGVIAAANVCGSVFFGWAGGRAPKGVLLGCIYVLRSIGLAWYFTSLPTPTSTLVFAAIMGFLWLGVVPLVAGSVAQMFGLRWQAMIQGIAFVSHQLGSFTGAYGGGILFDALGSYDLAWRIGVGLGLTAGVIQIAAALPRGPTRKPAIA